MGGWYVHAMTVALAEKALVQDTDRVELVLSRIGEWVYRVVAADGSCEFSRSDNGYETTAVSGRDPLGDQSTDRFLGTPDEQKGGFPTAATNAYPNAHERIAQLFDHPNAPDLAVVRTAAFHVHGNLGEHGSLGAIQSRAAFVAGGCGIQADGIVDRHLQATDVGPTIAAVLGCRSDEHGHHLASQDGKADTRLLEGSPAKHAIAFLLDGLGVNTLADALQAGDIPNIAGVLETGTCYSEGSIASLPSVTLPNHATLLTGLHPGHHGILSNEWLDRSTDQAHNLLDFAQMTRACDFLLPGVETLFEAIARNDPDAFCAATYEYADRGADFSTFAEVREGRRPVGIPRRGDEIPHATVRWCDENPQYEFISRIDSASTAQACQLLGPDSETPAPTFLWVNYSLTDTAGHHAGPHGTETLDALRDTDARMGQVLHAATEAGTLEGTAIFVLADHGMELTDPTVTGHYRSNLDTAGIAYRDLDDGLIYLT